MIDHTLTWNLPDAYGEALYEAAMAKGLGHKYVRRIPTNNPKRPWRYVYSVAAAGGVHHIAHMVEGAKFATEGGHFEVTAVNGDKLPR